MSIGSKITHCRKQKGITQEGLAKLLNVTNQAVSKWESDQCCPDILLLPKLADIFAISLDELFERENPAPITVDNLPWTDDDALRVVLYRGHRLLKNSNQGGKLEFHYDGEAQNIISAVSVTCGDVRGNVDAGTDVRCKDVGGSVDAGMAVSCENVNGDVDAGAGVTCGHVAGNVDAGSWVKCGNVDGDVDAGSEVVCGNVGGDVDAGGNVTCCEVHGCIDAGGSVSIKRS